VSRILPCPQSCHAPVVRFILLPRHSVSWRSSSQRSSVISVSCREYTKIFQSRRIGGPHEKLRDATCAVYQFDGRCRGSARWLQVVVVVRVIVKYHHVSTPNRSLASCPSGLRTGHLHLAEFPTQNTYAPGLAGRASDVEGMDESSIGATGSIMWRKEQAVDGASRTHQTT
jgi:hypothetical protein